MTQTARQNAARLGQADVSVRCAECAVNFAIPSPLSDVLNVSGETFYCPFGHAQYFPKGLSDVQIQKRRADDLERQLASAQEDARSERASHRATKGHLTRAKERAAAGVCPECHRNFAQVKRHMERMHPDALAEARP
jgi:hypothetical protein